MITTSCTYFFESIVHYLINGSDKIIIVASKKRTSAENGTIRIGTNAYQKNTFIAGIRGVTTGGAGAVPVLIDGNGQLGTIQSSVIFKEDIRPMGDVSERRFSLRPVTFRYKQIDKDGSRPIQFGLIAVAVAKAFP